MVVTLGLCLALQRTGKQQVRSAFNRTLPDGKGVELDLPFVGKVKLSNPLDFNVSGFRLKTYDNAPCKYVCQASGLFRRIML